MAIQSTFFVNSTPSVLSPGGTGLILNGLVLSTNPRIPTGAPTVFPSAAAVEQFTGPSTNLVPIANIYFGGFKGGNISQVVPAALLIAQYPTAAIAAWVRGGSVGTLAQVQAITPGVLTITVDGVSHTSSTITLSGATSLSNAASLVQAAFTAPGFTVAYDSISGGFQVTSGTTGGTSTITYGSGTIAAALRLTQAAGSIISQGAAAVSDPAAYMTAIVNYNAAWAKLMTSFDPDAGSGFAVKLQLAAWINATPSQFGRTYGYAAWDTQASPATTADDTSCFAYALAQASYSGTEPIWCPDYSKAAFSLCLTASTNFDAVNGSIGYAYKKQDGLVFDVTDTVTAQNLRSNGYNWYGVAAEGGTDWVFYFPGTITGPYAFASDYYNQMWSNSQFRTSFMTLQTGSPKVAYGTIGKSKLRAAIQTVVNSMLPGADSASGITGTQGFPNGGNGIIQPGVPLTTLQINQINTIAGNQDAGLTVQTQGYYYQVLDAAPSVRLVGGSPPINFFYTTGEQILYINQAAIEVQ